MIEAGFTGDVINWLLRVFTLESSSTTEEPYIVAFEGRNAEEDFQKYFKIEDELMRETGQPTSHITGADSIAS